MDQVIMAVGQAADLSFLSEYSTVKVEGGLVVVNEDTLETDMQGVYAGGDIARAAGAVIHAIAAGRRAAQSIARPWEDPVTSMKFCLHAETPIRF